MTGRGTKDKYKAISQKEITYCEAYIETSSVQAAKDASGFKYAAHTRSPRMREYIARRQRQILENVADVKVEVGLTPKWVIEKLMAEATDMKSPGAVRVSALNSLARIQGMFQDKVLHDFTKLSDAELINRAKAVIGGIGETGVAFRETPSENLPC